MVRSTPAIDPAFVSDTFYVRHGKRVLDLVAGLILLVLTAPLMAAIAVGVRVTMGSPVLFRQTRVGAGGVPFELVKFRTMSRSRRVRSIEWPGPDRRVNHKTALDPRHTRFGRLLRRSSLDELPQLLHVLRGEMSLVGPRPELPDIALRDGIIDHPRHLLRPGITGLWQLYAPRDEGIAANVHHDEEYLRHVTLLGDLRILAATPVVLLRRTGS